MGNIVPSGSGGSLGGASDAAGTLADVLERVLDKGVVIVGDIRVNLLDIELLTIRLRLLVAGVDTARRIGIDWWEHDPWLSGAADADERHALDERLSRIERRLGDGGAEPDALERENEELRAELARLRDARSADTERREGDG